MSAKAATASEVFRSIFLDQVAAAKQEYSVQLSINECLRLIKRCHLVTSLVLNLFPGLTRHDHLMVPLILYRMFGYRRNAKTRTLMPFYPEFAYEGNRRDMSLMELHRRLVKEHPTAHLTYKQMIRIFKHLKRAGLLGCREHLNTSAEGKISQLTSYYFNVEAWRTQLEIAKRPSKNTIKRRKPVVSQITAAAKQQALHDDQMRSNRELFARRLQIQAQKRLVFNTKPCDPGMHTIDPKGAKSIPPSASLSVPVLAPRVDLFLTQPLAPVSQVSSANKPLTHRAPRTGGKKGSPAASLCASFVATEIIHVEPSDNICPTGYQALPHHPAWEELLEDMLDHKNGPSWRQDLYQGKAEDGTLLRPRWLDSTLTHEQFSDTYYQVRKLDGKRLRVSREDLELGDLIERLTACPLRFQDWEWMQRQTRKTTNPLTRDRLITATALLWPGLGEDYHVSHANWRGKGPVDLNQFSLLPEVFETYFALKDDTDCDLMTRLETSGQDNLVFSTLPFLFFYRHAPATLLSPGNAGKLLANWDQLWRLVTANTHKGRASVQAQPVVWQEPIAPETLGSDPFSGVVLALGQVINFLTVRPEAVNWNEQTAALQMIPVLFEHGEARLGTLEFVERLQAYLGVLWEHKPHLWFDAEQLLGKFWFEVATLHVVDEDRKVAADKVKWLVQHAYIPPLAEHRPSLELL